MRSLPLSKTDIKDRYLSSKPYDKELPALKKLSPQLSMADIFALVEERITQDRQPARNVKIYLGQKCTGTELKEIGDHFGIGESGVSQVRRKLCQKMTKDKKLRKIVEKIEQEINLSRMKA